jgi:integrase
LLVLLWFSGIRLGEALGLRRSDLHFAESSMAAGCRVPGPHLHVVRRDNPNRASAKSRDPRLVPVGVWVLA